MRDEDRKDYPMATGLLDYFPDALAEVARVSLVSGDKHHPGEPVHWERHKSTDHPDCLLRHLVDRGKLDSDGMRHSAKVAWRALAILQLELEGAQEAQMELPLASVRRADSSDQQAEYAAAIKDYNRPFSVREAIEKEARSGRYDWFKT